jgi:pimeloyl-ACP methyl ester carboxylesterase
MTTTSKVGQRDREELLTGIPVNERRLQLAGVSTAVLEGGDGPPMVLLHGPSEFALVWLKVLPQLVRTHRVIVPDLPGHGASVIPDTVDADWVLGWLGELVEETCSTPPVLVGGTIGGAIPARFAADRPGSLTHLVLVDALGLPAFEPAPRFGLAMQRFLSQPTAGTYDRFMEVRGGTDLAGGTGPHQRSHHLDLGPARPRHPSRDRQGGRSPVRLAAARHRGRR